MRPQWPSLFSVFIENNDREVVLEASPLVEPLHRSTKSTDIHVDRAVALRPPGVASPGSVLDRPCRNRRQFHVAQHALATSSRSPKGRFRLRVRRGVFPVMLVVDTSYPIDGIAPDAVGHMRGGGYTEKGRK